jgi:phosphate transport system substrate-binding protein
LEGISRFQDGAVDIGASDIPMSDDQIAATKGGPDLIHIPTAYSGIVLTYNLPNYSAKLNLTGAQIASIYLGEITYWDDPQLVKNNPALAGRHFQIITIHRGDGSGTTYGFTAFLSASSSDWRTHDGLGTGFAVYWPVGGGLGGNAALVQGVEDNDYSIGYTDLGFALKKGLPVASIENPAGKFIQPTLASISAAVASAGAASDGTDLRLNLTNVPASDAYPITTGTYLIVHQHQADADKAKAIVSFLKYAVHGGQAIEPSMNAVSLPANIVTLADKAIATITAATAGMAN